MGFPGLVFYIYVYVLCSLFFFWDKAPLWLNFLFTVHVFFLCFILTVLPSYVVSKQTWNVSEIFRPPLTQDFLILFKAKMMWNVHVETEYPMFFFTISHPWKWMHLHILHYLKACSTLLSSSIWTHCWCRESDRISSWLFCTSAVICQTCSSNGYSQYLPTPVSCQVQDGDSRIVPSNGTGHPVLAWPTQEIGTQTL